MMESLNRAEPESKDLSMHLYHCPVAWIAGPVLNFGQAMPRK